MNRVKTGVDGLDEVLNGGFPEESITLVSGPPGSGKSILGYQFINQGIQQGERCLLITLDRKENKVIAQAEEFNFLFRKAVEEGKLKVLYMDVNKRYIYETIIKEILKGGYDRVVIDSITPLTEAPFYLRDMSLNENINFIDPEDFSVMKEDIPLKRLHLRYIMDALESIGCTAIVTAEAPLGSTGESRDTVSEFLADGVIFLNFDPAMDRRKLTVLKMRNTPHTLKTQNIIIGNNGIELMK